MTWKFVVRWDALGFTGLPWDRYAQRQFRLSAEVIEQLEAGKIVQTASRGGTKLFLLNGPDTEATQTKCPMCDGSGHVDWYRIYGAVPVTRGGKKTA